MILVSVHGNNGRVSRTCAFEGIEFHQTDKRGQVTHFCVSEISQYCRLIFCFRDWWVIAFLRSFRREKTSCRNFGRIKMGKFQALPFNYHLISSTHNVSMMMLTSRARWQQTSFNYHSAAQHMMVCKLFSMRYAIAMERKMRKNRWVRNFHKSCDEAEFAQTIRNCLEDVSKPKANRRTMRTTC